MAYLIVDPVGRYPAEILTFLARQVEQGAVAVFSSRARYALWQGKWKARVGELVLASYLAPDAPSRAALAAEIGARWKGLKGVVAWDEESVLLGADLGERLRLGWNSRRVIERCRDKGVMKAWLSQRGGVRVNAARVVGDRDEALAFQRQVGSWPIVVKPTGGAGSENVYFARDINELLQRCQQVLENGAGAVLLEEFIGGLEYCVNVWLYDRRPSHGVDNLYFETTSVPTRDPVFWALGDYASRVVERLELRRAPIHMEVKVDRRGPCLIEVGARPAGGNLPLLASRLYGRSLLELAAVHWLAEMPVTRADVDYARWDAAQAKVVLGVQSHPIPRIRAVHGLDVVRRLPSFVEIGMVRPVGTRAPVTIDLDSRGYEVYLIHADPAQVARDAKVIRDVLRYE
jgi:biotin carboxylase